MSPFSLSSTLSQAPARWHLLFPLCLEAHLLPRPLEKACPKAGLGQCSRRCLADLAGRGDAPFLGGSIVPLVTFHPYLPLCS